jgi:hypothetical protein
LVVDRLPRWAAYLRQSGPAVSSRSAREIGRYRADFRFTVTTGAGNPSWYYEDWLILIANSDMKTDGFVSRSPTVMSATAFTLTAERYDQAGDTASDCGGRPTRTTGGRAGCHASAGRAVTLPARGIDVRVVDAWR